MELQHVQERIEASDCDLSGSTFNDVKLSGAAFVNVNLTGATIRNANLSGLEVQDANIARIRILNSDLRHASLLNCLTDGMTMDGVPISEMMAAYLAAKSRQDQAKF